MTPVPLRRKKPSPLESDLGLYQFGTIIFDPFVKTDMPSSVVRAMNYNEETRVLRIIYTSGLKYDYKDVPAEVFIALKNAGSKGIFLNKNIKGKFAYEKVPEK